MTRIRLWGILALVVACTAATTAGAQSKDSTSRKEVKKQEDYTVNINVNHGFAYRPDAWVPVDILVLNTKKDLAGWLEVRVYGSDDLESPIYRVPMQSPKDSHKHFQVICRLGATASRLSVQLYNGRRAVLDYPTFLDINPIEDRDLLSLVLDQDGAGFGFLNSIAETFYQDNPRFYRETVTPEMLSFLSNRLQCYTAFDVIVFGKTELSRLGKPQRDVLNAYVQQGGRIVFCTGEYADRYRDPWIESMAGVAVGNKEVVKEDVVARAFFSEEEARGARADRDIFLAELKPTQPGVKTLATASTHGAARILATRRAMGSGYVYMLATDADGRAFQDCPSFLKIWDEASRRRTTEFQINRSECRQLLERALPMLCGVVLQPRSSVIIYLGLYGMAVLVNWLVFNRLKRREWSWATLVLLSTGFTLYAMFFGTSGRATESEINEVRILRMAAGDEVATGNPVPAEQITWAGLLSPHTSTRKLQLTGDSPLIMETSTPNLYRGAMRFQSRPFTFIQDDTPRVEGLRLGASDLRLVEIDSTCMLPGPITGKVRTESNSVYYTVKNDSGFRFSDCYLYVHGQFVSLSPPAPSDQVEGNTAYAAQRGRQQDYITVNGNTMDYNLDYLEGIHFSMGSANVDDLVREAMPAFRRYVMARAVRGYAESGEFAEVPLLFAWTAERQPPAIESATDAKHNINETLVIAPLQWEDSSREDMVYSLPVFIENSRGGFYMNTAPVDGATARCHILLPPPLTKDAIKSRLCLSLGIWGQGIAPPGAMRWEPAAAADKWQCREGTASGREPTAGNTYIIDGVLEAATDIPPDKLRVLETSAQRANIPPDLAATMLSPDGNYKNYKIISGVCHIGIEGDLRSASPLQASCTLEVTRKVETQGDLLPWQ